jgi:hypothetical protein
MSKTKKNIDAQEQNQPAYVAELLLNGTVTLTANTREELAEMVDNIPAECHYGAGAVGRHPETGLYSLRIDLTTKD